MGPLYTDLLLIRKRRHFVTNRLFIRLIVRMKKTTILLPIFALLLLTSAVYAHGDNRGRGRGGDEARVRVEFEQGFEVPKFEIEGQTFEITGEVTSISGNSFVVFGQTVMIDPSRVAEFEQKGILAVGNIVKVEGIIEGGTKFAREIKVLGMGAGRFKFEVRGVNTQASPQPSASPSPSASPNSSPSPSASPTPSGSPSPSASPASDVQVEVRARGPIDQVVAFLEQVLDFLRDLV